MDITELLRIVDAANAAANMFKSASLLSKIELTKGGDRLERLIRWIATISRRAAGISNVAAANAQVQSTLKGLGWEPVELDPLAITGLCVHATLDPTFVPAQLPNQYSGRKTLKAQIDAAPFPDGSTSAGGHYFQDPVSGDSAYAITIYKGATPVKQDTLRPARHR